MLLAVIDMVWHMGQLRKGMEWRPLCVYYVLLGVLHERRPLFRGSRGTGADAQHRRVLGHEVKVAVWGEVHHALHGRPESLSVTKEDQALFGIH